MHELRQQLDDQLQKNADEKLRNERTAGEVQDLRGGTAAIERARYEMGMVKDGEVFVQFVSPNAPAVPLNNTPSNTSTRGAVSAAPVRVVPNPQSIAKPSRHHGGDRARPRITDARLLEPIEKAREMPRFLFPAGSQFAERCTLTTTIPGSRS